MGVLPQYLTPILSGKRNISEKLLEIFCRHYKISQKELYIEVGDFARLMTAATEIPKFDENDINIKKRLLQIADSMGLSIRSFEIACGLQRGNISNMTDDSAIGSDKLTKIIDSFPFIDSEWILTGKGSMIKDNVDKSSLKKGEAFKLINESVVPVATPAPADTNEGIPLIPVSAIAGFGQGDLSTVLEYECERYFVPLFKGAEFLITVRGSSMYPKYSNGDVVACKKVSLDTFFQWNKVYVIDSEQGALVKRIRKGKDEEHITLVSENDKYEPFEIHRNEIRSLAIVIGVIRLE